MFNRSIIDYLYTCLPICTVLSKYTRLCIRASTSASACVFTTGLGDRSGDRSRGEASGAGAPPERWPGSADGAAPGPARPSMRGSSHSRGSRGFRGAGVVKRTPSFTKRKLILDHFKSSVTLKRMSGIFVRPCPLESNLGKRVPGQSVRLKVQSRKNI